VRLCDVMDRDRTGTVSGTVPARNNVGSVSEQFLFRSRNMLSILFVLSETVGDNYLNDGHLPPEIPQIDDRDSFNSVSHRLLAVYFEVPDWSSAAAGCG